MGSCSCIDLEASKHLDVESKYPLCIKSFIHSVCSEGVSFGANLKLGGTGQPRYICMQQNSWNMKTSTIRTIRRLEDKNWKNRWNNYDMDWQYCADVLWPGFGDREQFYFCSVGREEVGHWGLSTLLSPLEIFHWHFCYLTTLPPYHLTTLPSYPLATLPSYHLTTLPPYQHHREEKCQWKKRSMDSVSPMFQQVTVCCSILFTSLCYHIWS